MTISEKLRFYRKEKYLTQKQLAELTGIATITIQQYELGKRTPKINLLQKIANALEVDINLLLEDEKSPLQQVMERDNSPLLDGYVQRKLTENIKFENIDIELVKMFHLLNNKGKEKVVEYTSDLSNNPNYKSTP